MGKNKTEDELIDFSAVHYVSAILLLWDILVTSVVLIVILRSKKRNNFLMHIISMSVNDIVFALLAIPRWLIKVSNPW